MKIIKQIFPLSACFLLTLVLFSSTAFAAETGGAVRFVDVYGLDLADGETQTVKFELPKISAELDNITNETSMEDIVEQLNWDITHSGYSASYNKTSGQLIITDKTGELVDLKVCAGNEELVPRPSASPAMADLLATITQIFTAAIGWVGTVAETITSNPLLLIGVVIGFIGTGVVLFRRLLRV